MNNTPPGLPVTATASFYHTTLLLGLLPGDPVVKWAETYIEQHETAPSPFFDIVSTPAGDITALRYALHDLCNGTVSPEVLRSVFTLIRAQYTDGKRSFDDTMRVLFQVRYFLKLEKPLADTINTFETDYESAVHNGATTGLEKNIAVWLKQISGGADDLNTIQ